MLVISFVSLSLCS